MGDELHLTERRERAQYLLDGRATSRHRNVRRHQVRILRVNAEPRRPVCRHRGRRKGSLQAVDGGTIDIGKARGSRGCGGLLAGQNQGERRQPRSEGKALHYVLFRKSANVSSLMGASSILSSREITA